MRQVIFSNKQSLAGKNGFTIIELLVVIVVIGVLTTLTVISYGGIQARTRDTIVKNAAKQLGTQLQRFSADTGKTPLQTGGGFAGTGIGWVSSQIVDVNYPVAVETVLRDSGYLPNGFTAGLPKNKIYGNSSTSSLMLYACGSKYVVFYSLESSSGDDVADFANVKTQCPDGVTLEANYNMKGGYIFS